MFSMINWSVSLTTGLKQLKIASLDVPAIKSKVDRTWVKQSMVAKNKTYVVNIN